MWILVNNSLIFSPFMYERYKEDIFLFYPRKEFSLLQLIVAKVLRGFLSSHLIFVEVK